MTSGEPDNLAIAAALIDELGEQVNILKEKRENTVPDNLSSSTEAIKDLGFKVPESLHREFKGTATDWGMSMTDLLIAAHNLWVEQNGRRPK